MNDIQDKMNDRLDIRLFGGIEIRLNDQPVTGFASSKAEALLAYLVCNPGVHNRERLATMLWDSRSQERAMGNLRVLLNSIRNQLLTPSSHHPTDGLISFPRKCSDRCARSGANDPGGLRSLLTAQRRWPPPTDAA